MRHCRATALTAALAGVLTEGLAAVAESPEGTAPAAAESGRGRVDSGRYGESGERAATLFPNAVTLDQWTQALRGVRAPRGEGAPDGRDAVVQHDTVFRNKAKATETITPMVDADGAWRVSGHHVQ